MDDAVSHTVRNPPNRTGGGCEFCVPGDPISWERLVFEEDSWSGADIFMTRGNLGDIIVSERFRQFVEQCSIANAWLIPAEKWAYDEHRSRKLGRSERSWYVRDN
jgi:hypothetical protein